MRIVCCFAAVPFLLVSFFNFTSSIFFSLPSTFWGDGMPAFFTKVGWDRLCDETKSLGTPT
jgi:hypothetical protein